MKSFKVFCAASVFALSLSIPAYADEPVKPPTDIHQPGIVKITGGSNGTNLPSVSGAGGATAPAPEDIGFSLLVDILFTLIRIF